GLFFETGSFKHFDYVIVQSSQTGDQVDFILEPPFYKGKPGYNLPELLLGEEDRNFIQDRLLARSVKQYYYPTEKISGQETPALLIADRSFILDDYTRFDNIATTFREYVPEIAVRNRENK